MVYNIIKAYREFREMCATKGQGWKPTLNGHNLWALNQHGIKKSIKSVVDWVGF